MAFRRRRFVIVPNCAPHCEMLGILGSTHEEDKDAFRDIAPLTPNYTLTSSSSGMGTQNIKISCRKVKLYFFAHEFVDEA